jgi:DNA-binding Lrp family transcriptional regulator
MQDLDQTDRALLALLKHDGRASVTELAGKLGVSRATVKARMAALRANGVILRFSVDISDHIDQDLIQAVSLLEIQLSKVDKVHRALKRMPELRRVHTTNGKWAVVAQSHTQSLAQFDRFLNEIGRIDGVTNVETCLLLTRLQ